MIERVKYGKEWMSHSPWIKLIALMREKKTFYLRERVFEEERENSIP